MPVFVSHAALDEPWAQWIALQLRAAGHDVKLETAGTDFAQRIAVALSGPDPVLILLSAAHRGTDHDWKSVAALPAAAGRLVTLRLDTTDPPRPLRALPCRSLHGLDEEDTVDLLLGLVGGPRRNL